MAISPDGTAYYIALGLNGVSNGSVATTAILVVEPVGQRRLYLGRTHDAVLLQCGDDKEAVTADHDAHYVYAVWDRPASGSISVWFSRTADGAIVSANTSPANAFATANRNSWCCRMALVVDIFVWTTHNNMNSVSCMWPRCAASTTMA